ncbi:MAG: LPS assembly lipoprotein LptE [Victivallaceae bacterium]|nr:LPS assembly lipoprotein LptE [Victivallaceae bacterium]
MRKMKYSLALCLALTLCGCGYRIGYIGHPQLKTIGIGPVTNETLAYNLSTQIRSVLAECFQVDGTMKVTDEKKADCILYAKVVSYKYSEISWSSDTDDDDLRPNQWRVSISITYSVMIPGRAAPLIKDRTATGSATFMSGPDLEVSRTYALRQAGYEAAKNIVVQVTEGW